MVHACGELAPAGSQAPTQLLVTAHPQVRWWDWGETGGTGARKLMGRTKERENLPIAVMGKTDLSWGI